MRNLLYLLLISVLASCASTRHTVTSTSTVHDTVAIAQHDTVQLTKLQTSTVYVHDTVIKSGGEHLEQTFTPAQLKPLHDDAGRKHRAYYDASDGALHQSITVDTNGNVTVISNVDSINTVIANLIERNSQQSDSLAHYRGSSTAKTVVAAASYTEFYQRSKSWLGRNWWWMVAIIVIAGAIELIRSAKSRL